MGGRSACDRAVGTRRRLAVPRGERPSSSVDETPGQNFRQPSYSRGPVCRQTGVVRRTPLPAVSDLHGEVGVLGQWRPSWT